MEEDDRIPVVFIRLLVPFHWENDEDDNALLLDLVKATIRLLLLLLLKRETGENRILLVRDLFFVCVRE